MLRIKCSVPELRLGSAKVLEGIDFEVPEQSFFTIIGPNGAGKSVLLSVLLGKIKAPKSEVFLSSSDPNDIGYVPQFKTFDRSFPARVVDFVVSGTHRSWPLRIKPSEREQALKALSQVQAESLVDRNLKELSGGELQRCYLARALIRPRKLLILDEPATGIDALGEMDLYELLETYRSKEQLSILMVTHDLEVARHHSTEVLLLNRRQIAFGKPSSTLKPEFIDRAFGHQHSHSEHHHA